MSIPKYILLSIAATLIAAIEFYRYELPAPLGDIEYKKYCEYFQTLGSTSYCLFCLIVIFLTKEIVLRGIVSGILGFHLFTIYKINFLVSDEHHYADWIAVAITSSVIISSLFIKSNNRTKDSAMQDGLEETSMVDKPST